jgi:hypothetical protein
MNNLAAQPVIQCPARASAIRDGQSGTRAGFSPNTSAYLVSTIPPVLCLHLHLLVALTQGKGDENRELSNRLGSFGTRAAFD